MQTRPRVAVAVEPYFARSAIHAALAADPRVEAVLLPRDPDVRLQADTADVDALIVSHDVVRSDAVVARLSPSGSVEVQSGAMVRRLDYEGLARLVDVVLSYLARRRHPSSVRAPMAVSAMT